MLAEREGFEPPVPCDITGFQDRRLKPLGHLSVPSEHRGYPSLRNEWIIPKQNPVVNNNCVQPDYIMFYSAIFAKTILPALVWSTLVTTAVTFSPTSFAAPSTTTMVPSSK